MGSGNIRKFEIRLGQTGLTVLIVGMVVLLCLSFLFGVGVGKNIDTYPEKISSLPQRFLALFWRPAKVASGQKTDPGTQAKPEQDNVDLTFHQALTSSKTVPIQPQPEAKKTMEVEAFADGKAALPAQPPSVRQQENAALAKSEAAGQKKDVSEKTAADSKSKGRETASASGSYQVYVASLKDRAKADQIHRIVSRAGYASKVVKVDLKEKGLWYRVIATGFDSKARAEAAADKLSKKARTKCVVRQAAPEKVKP